MKVKRKLVTKEENNTEMESQSELRKMNNMTPNSSTNSFDVVDLEDNEKRDNDSQSIRESNFQFSNILDNTDTVIITIDEMQIIRYFNRGAEKTFQYEAEDVIGKELHILFPEQVKDFAEFHDMTRKKDKRGEIIGLRKNGTEFPAEVSISKITVNGHIIFYIFMRDITKRKKIEANLNRKRNKLIRVNNALISANNRISELSNQLIDAEKFAALGEMATNISHEINNQLSIITAQAEIQLAENPSANFKNALDNIIQSVLELGDFTRNYMMLAKPHKIKMTSIKLSDVLQRSVNSIKSLGYLNNIELLRTYMDSEPSILGDNDLLGQVFRNLIINAVHATSGISRPKISIKTRISTNRLFVNAIISDNGVGIKSEYLDKIFHHYFTTKGKREGTGLGLTIVKEIVEEKHKGKIKVDSSPGERTHFHVMIPIFNRSKTLC